MLNSDVLKPDAYDVRSARLREAPFVAVSRVRGWIDPSEIGPVTDVVPRLFDQVDYTKAIGWFYGLQVMKPLVLGSNVGGLLGYYLETTRGEEGVRLHSS
jgi:hypothetical protein